MFCKNCGKELSEGAHFCTNCGVNNTAQSDFGKYASNVPGRNIAMAIILSIITCGIYSIFWFIKLTDETNNAIGDSSATSGGMAFFLSIITCGIYAYIWTYNQGEKLDHLAQMRSQAPASRGIVYLILTFFGLSIVAYALMQDSLNKLA